MSNTPQRPGIALVWIGVFTLVLSVAVSAILPSPGAFESGIPATQGSRALDAIPPAPLSQPALLPALLVPREQTLVHPAFRDLPVERTGEAGLQAQPQELFGRVLEPDGSPSSGANVQLKLGSGTEDSRLTRRADADGFFVFPPVRPSGHAELMAWRGELQSEIFALDLGRRGSHSKGIALKLSTKVARMGTEVTDVQPFPWAGTDRRPSFSGAFPATPVARLLGGVEPLIEGFLPLGDTVSGEGSPVGLKASLVSVGGSEGPLYYLLLEASFQDSLEAEGALSGQVLDSLSPRFRRYVEGGRKSLRKMMRRKHRRDSKADGGQDSGSGKDLSQLRNEKWVKIRDHLKSWLQGGTLKENVATFLKRLSPENAERVRAYLQGRLGSSAAN